MLKLRKISAFPLAKIFCCLHALLGFILGIVVTLGSLAGQEDEGIWSLGAWSLLIFPLVNSFLGFLTGLFLSWCYNLFAQWLGGIEFEFEEK